MGVESQPLGYGAHPKIKINNQKAVYIPGDTLSITISILDDNGTPLSITDYASSGIGLIVNIINGPKQNYGFIGESVRINPGPMNPGPEPLFMSPPNLQPIPDPDKDTDDYTVTYEFKLPSDLSSDKYGAYTIVVEVDRVYGGEVARNTAFIDFQVGTEKKTEISVGGCPHCHQPETPMALGHLIPPMTGAIKVEQCIACHTPEAAGGVIDFQRIIHSAHIRKTEGYLAAKNDCTVCHLTDESTDAVSPENCKYCHETFHSNNSPGYKETECKSCHTNDSTSHIDPKR